MSHAQYIDYLSLNASLTEMDKRFRNARYQFPKCEPVYIKK